MSKPLPLREIAARITAHLRRFEADPEINERVLGLAMYSGARADTPLRGRLVRVTYIAFQGAHRLSRTDAEAYLAWLDAGNVGDHLAMKPSSEINRTEEEPT